MGIVKESEPVGVLPEIGPGKNQQGKDLDVILKPVVNDKVQGPQKPVRSIAGEARDQVKPGADAL